MQTYSLLNMYKHTHTINIPQRSCTTVLCLSSVFHFVDFMVPSRAYFHYYHLIYVCYGKNEIYETLTLIPLPGYLDKSDLNQKQN